MPNDLHAEWGARLARIRNDAGLTQTALAAKAGTTKSVVHNIEKARSAPPDHLRTALASALGITTAELFPYPDALAGAQ